MSKVIVIDGGKSTFSSIEIWGSAYLREIEKICKELKPDYEEEFDTHIYDQAVPILEEKLRNREVYIQDSWYTFMLMTISVLKKIKVEKDDLVILAVDAKNSWRKAFYPSYKGQRGEARDKKKHIDYPYHYKKIGEVVEKLHNFSHIHAIQLSNIFTYEDLINSKEGLELIEPDQAKFDEVYGIEADDILAVACQYFKDKEVICVTGDKDCYQLTYWDHVKVFSYNLRTPKGGKNGGYVVDSDPLKILESKCRLGDISDNIIVDKSNPELDAKERRFIIDLISLPSFLKEPVIKELSKVVPKNNQYDQLPFQNSLAKRFSDIYTEKNYVSYEYCVELSKKKKRATKKKSTKKVKA